MTCCSDRWRSATISVVLIAVIGSLTFLPATLAILGDGVNRLRLPILGRDRPEGSGIWAVVVRAVMARPVIAFVASAGLLLVLAVPALRLHIGQSDFASFPDSVDSVQGINLLNEKWPEGSTLSLRRVVTKANEPATTAAIETFKERLLTIRACPRPADGPAFRRRHRRARVVVMAGGQNDERNREIIREVRGDVVPEVFGGLDGVRAYVTGQAAQTLDVVDFYSNGMPQVVAFVLDPVVPAPARRLPLDRHPDQGDPAQPALDRGGLRAPRPRLRGRPWLPSLLGFKPGPDRVVRAGVHLHDPVRPLDGLPRVHPHADQGGPRPRADLERGRRPRDRDHRGDDHQRRRDHGRRVRVFVTLELSIIKQLGFGLAVAVLPRRDDRPERPAAGHDAAPRGAELVAAAFLRWLPQVTIEGEVDAPPDEATETGRPGNGNQPGARRSEGIARPPRS